MKKYLVLFHDEWEQKPDVMAAWQAWFASVGDALVAECSRHLEGHHRLLQADQVGQ